MAAAPAERTFKCPTCGAVYAEAAWTGMVLAEILQPREISLNILRWPHELCIEVRVCPCGARISAKRPWSAEGTRSVIDILLRTARRSARGR
jgi:hypothetical protein